MAAALVQAVRGDDVPNRLALREVARELASWPIYSAQEGTGATAGGTGAGAAAAAPPGEEGMARPATRPQIGRGDPDAGSALPASRSTLARMPTITETRARTWRDALSISA